MDAPFGKAGSMGSFEPMIFWENFEFHLVLFAEDRVQVSELIACLDVQEVLTRQLKFIVRALFGVNWRFFRLNYFTVKATNACM